MTVRGYHLAAPYRHDSDSIRFRRWGAVSISIIVDKTGLTGTFDMVLRFNPDANDTSSDLPSLFAVQEQLGLKLDPQTAPAEVLVIDRVDRPTENWISRVRQTPRRTLRLDTGPA